MILSQFLDIWRVKWVLNILKLNTSAHRCYSSLFLERNWREAGGKHDQSNEDNQRSLAVDLGLNLFKQFCVSFYYSMKIEW